MPQGKRIMEKLPKSQDYLAFDYNNPRQICFLPGVPKLLSGHLDSLTLDTLKNKLIKEKKCNFLQFVQAMERQVNMKHCTVSKRDICVGLDPGPMNDLFMWVKPFSCRDLGMQTPLVPPIPFPEDFEIFLFLLLRVNFVHYKRDKQQNFINKKFTNNYIFRGSQN